MRRIVVVLGAVVSATVLAAGCTGGGSVTGARAAAGEAGHANASLNEAQGRPNPEAPRAASNRTLLDGRDRVVTAAITLRVADISVANDVDAIARKAGGMVDGDDRTSDGAASATITLELPQNSVGDVLTAIAKLGHEQSRSMSTQDVTAQVVDVNSRITTAEASIDRVTKLFRSAQNLNDTVTIERELAQREADLESLQAQQRSLSTQTDMAHLTVNLTTVPGVAPKSAHHRSEGGFVGGLRRGWHNFATATGAAFTALGLIGPFAILLGVVAAAVHVVRRRRRALPEVAPEAIG